MRDELFAPGCFLGEGRRPPYFEGWYYRATAPDGRAFCLIPGICRTESGGCCFLQVLGPAGARCLRYPLSAFSYARGRTFFRVGNSAFDERGFRLDAEGVRGEAEFREQVPYPASPLCPGIMGPFAYLPVMECRHAVLCVRSGLAGWLEVSGERVQLSGGVGYMEKDWGGAFPDPYLWAQCGSFAGERDAAFFLSAARVPVLGLPMRGLIAFLYRGGRFWRFTTYLGARVEGVAQEPEGEVRVELRSPRFSLAARLTPGRGFALAAPGPGGMERRVTESAAGVRVELRRNGPEGGLLFAGRGEGAMELYGGIGALCARRQGAHW